MSFAFHSLRHFLIDLDGVLFRGQTVLPHAADFIADLRRRHIAFRLVTNNATLTQSQYVDKLDAMGISVTPGEIFTSSIATSLYLTEQEASDSRGYLVGEIGLRAAVEEAGVHVVDAGPADWVIVGLDRHLTYDKLADAALLIRDGARFIGSNPDLSFPSERGLVPGAGALLALLQATTGVQPTIIGKPQPLMLRLALESMNASPADSAMLGDRLDTDIQGAVALGIPSILVLTGVSTREEAEHGSIKPDLIVTNLEDLQRRWTASERSD